MKSSKLILPRKLLAMALSLAVAVTWMIPSFAVYADDGDEPAPQEATEVASEEAAGEIEEGTTAEAETPAETAVDEEETEPEEAAVEPAEEASEEATEAEEPAAEAATELPEAVNGTITLTDDVNLADTAVISEDTTIDLAGHTIAGPSVNYPTVLSVTAGTLTVKDSSEQETGAIKVSGNYGTAISGSVVLESGSVEAEGAMAYGINVSRNGAATIKGGKISVSGTEAIAINLQARSSAEMEGGTISAVYSGSEGIYGAYVAGANAAFTMNGGEISVTASGGKAIQLMGNNAKAILNDGKISVKGDESAGIATSPFMPNQIDINGGYISASGNRANGIFLEEDCTLNISGGTVESLTDSAVSAYKGNTVNVTAGTVSGKTYGLYSGSVSIGANKFTISEEAVITGEKAAVYDPNYVLMNIPYADFYGTGNVSVADVDAVTSATNKTGNYGKAGGAFHSGITADVAEDGTAASVGGVNGSKVEGIIWPVKVVSVYDTEKLAKEKGGKVITDDSSVVTATAGKGAVSSQTLHGYEALTEAPAYSFYVLGEKPDSYLEFAEGKFVTAQETAEEISGATVGVQYGTNWGDVQLTPEGIDATGDKLVNAIVFTTSDGNKVGLYHLDQIWANNSLGWKVDATPGLDGKTITNIRYYCSVKDTDLTDETAPAYANYVYDYPVSVSISEVYTDEVTAEFTASNTITLGNLPENAKNVTAKVYYTSGGRNATYSYLTPMVVDPADDDIDPVFVEVKDGKITIEAGEVTNKAGTTATYGTPENGKTYTVELASDNYIIRKTSAAYDSSVYVLMNIPYSAFYSAESASVADVDAVTSATNKTGNYGKAAGAFHSGTTASEDGQTATGGETGSKVQGVTWPVKFDSVEEASALKGNVITDESTVITATLGKGSTNSQTLRGYEALTEAPAYSYYVLSEKPDFYAVYSDGKFTMSGEDAESVSGAEVTVQYGTNWGDVQLGIEGIDATSDKLVNAMVLTTSDGRKVGLYHLDQIWANNSIGWKVDATAGLDGKEITNIRYYCSIKDTDLTDETAPAYANYVYDYTVSATISEVYTGEVTAEFTASNTITLGNLPENAKNVTAKVYYTTGGRNATYSYLTPMVVDPADDDIDPVFVEVKDGKITIEAGEVTNKAGTTATYGTPENGKTYTVELASDNYIIRKTSAAYNEEEVAEKEAAAKAEIVEKANTAKNAASKVTAANYTASSYKAVQDAQKALDAAIAGGDAAAIKAATEKLNAAVANAKVKSAASIKKVTPLSKTYKVKKLKKKAQSFTLKATVSSGAKATFAKANKAGKSKIKVSKTGKVTLKKGLKKGTYKVKVKVTAPATANAKAVTKTVTVKIKVKK